MAAGGFSQIIWLIGTEFLKIKRISPLCGLNPPQYWVLGPSSRHKPANMAYPKRCQVRNRISQIIRLIIRQRPRHLVFASLSDAPRWQHGVAGPGTHTVSHTISHTITDCTVLEQIGVLTLSIGGGILLFVAARDGRRGRKARWILEN